MRFEPSIIVAESGLTPDEVKKLKALQKGDMLVFGVLGFVFLLLIGNIVTRANYESGGIVFGIWVCIVAYWSRIHVLHKKDLATGKAYDLQTFIIKKKSRLTLSGIDYYIHFQGVKKPIRVPKQTFDQYQVQETYRFRVSASGNTVFRFEKHV